MIIGLTCLFLGAAFAGARAAKRVDPPWIHVFFIIFIFIYLTSCQSRDSGPIDNLCGQEPCYEGPFDPPWVSAYHAGLRLDFDEDLTHDNRVLETDNFLIFSDASDDWAKIRMGQTAEAALVLIKDLFEVSSEDLGIRDLSSKIRVYSARRNPGRLGPRSFYNGFIMWAYDSYTYATPELIPDITEHECTHVVQFRLGGAFSRVWAWFCEGLAEHVSNGGPYKVIRCWQEVDDWRQAPGHVNPISIQYLEQIPDYDRIDWQRREEYYPIFGVAVRYLTDPGGHGKTPVDIKNLFIDIGHGLDFGAAFRNHIGMSLEYYQDHFYALMQAFLPASCDD